MKKKEEESFYALVIEEFKDRGWRGRNGVV